MSAEPVIKSFLDTDLYKITMHAVVYKNFPEVPVKYKFTNRTAAMKFNSESMNWIAKQISLLSELSFKDDEIQFLKEKVPYLPKDYFQYLTTFKLDPDKQVEYNPDHSSGDIQLEIKGLWIDTIFYEILLLELISEAYFKFVETLWNYDGQQQLVISKLEKLFANNILFSEFGTRRRRSHEGQDLIIKTMVDYTKKTQSEEKQKLFLGTSNLLLAKRYNLNPIGTVAHEWIMGVASISQDYTHANGLAMKYWINTVGCKNAGLALTDTFGTEAFLKNFVNSEYMDCYVGFRQDSGDPMRYVDLMKKELYDSGILPKFSKVICFSDALNVNKCLSIAKYSIANGFNCNFGIGTNFTNDYISTETHEKSAPLNIVIKLSECAGRPAIKISDNLGKNMGDKDTVGRVKQELGYVEKPFNNDETHRW